jgi:RNA polymerase sigma factor for flagellar operon FliA
MNAPTLDRTLRSPVTNSAVSSPREQTSSNRPADRGFSEAERARLAVENLKLVHSIARRIHARLPRSVELDDLVNEGFAGLLEAIDRYDGYRSVPLHLFARTRITGAILDMLRGLDWVPRTVRRRAEQLDHTRDSLQLRLGRAPNREEVAGALGVELDKLDRMERNAQIRRVTSLDAPTSPNSETPLVETLAVDDDPVEARCEEERRAAVMDAVDRLPPRERAAVRGFYLEELPLVEVGRALGVSESRASQLHRNGVERLRFKTREHYEG